MINFIIKHSSSSHQTRCRLFLLASFFHCCCCCCCCLFLLGSGSISGTEATPQHALVLGDGDHITAVAAAAAAPSSSGSDTEGAYGEGTGLRFLLIAGAPIKEPVVQHGPFVMNTEDEIAQAFMDYQAGRLQNPGDDVWAADEGEL